MKRNLLKFFFVLLLLGLKAYAQTKTVTGTVTGKDDGVPIPGVTVTVSGTKSGTVTNADGVYTIKVPEGQQSLTFSSVGYVTKTVPVQGLKLNVTMEGNQRVLNEVVVTGVGVATQKKLVAIDVGTVDSKDFGKSANANVTQALTGQIPGVQIVQKTSQPGAAPTIQLRSFTTLGGTQPLILVDGVQTSNDILTSIDPNTVDHVEVVKGAAGGMLYGSQGGNGVIQIFTKKGVKNGKLTVDVSSKYSNDRIIELNDIVAKKHHYVTDAAGNILTAGGAIVAPNANGVWSDPASLPFGTSPTTVQNDKDYIIPTYDHVAQANRVANTFTNSVSVRGGTEKMDIAFSMSNLAQQDVFSQSFNRTNFNLNAGFNVAKGLTLRTNTQLFYTWNNLTAGSRFNMIMTPRYIDLTYINPNTGRKVVKPSNTADGNNPLAETDVHKGYNKVPRLLQTFELGYKFPKFVDLNVKFSEDARINDGYDFYSNQTGLPQTVFFGGNIAGQIANSSTTSRTEYGNASAFIRTDFKDDFNLNVPIKTVTQVTYDFTKGYSHSYGNSAVALPPYPPYTINTATGAKTASESYDGYLYFGYLVNQTIDYANLFGISGGFRSDWSSAFGGASKPFTFPRGTVYFNPSELFDSHGMISNWKLRGAFGEAGVQPGNFSRQITLGAQTLGSANPLTALVVPNTLTNEDLRVQVTKELEVGTDITFTPFKNSNWLSSVTFNGTYWHRTSNDAIQTALTAPSTGGTGILNNLVSLAGHGIELGLDIIAYRDKNINWFVGPRFATQKTIVTKISNGQPINASLFTISEGQQLGLMYGQTQLKSVDQLKPDGTRYIAVADVGNYVLVNGGVVNKNTYAAQLTASNDLSFLGNSVPDFTSSLINRVGYKKLNVSFQFDWNHGQKIYNATRQYLARDQLSSDFDKAVTINGNTGSYTAYWNSFYNALNPLSAFIEDGSFIRLRDISISYDLTSLIKAKWLKSLVFSASGRNIATFTKYSGLDPEVTNAVSSSTGGGLGSIGGNQGVDYYGQPNLKSYQFSFNIGF